MSRTFFAPFGMAARTNAVSDGPSSAPSGLIVSAVTPGKAPVLSTVTIAVLTQVRVVGGCVTIAAAAGFFLTGLRFLRLASATPLKATRAIRTRAMVWVRRCVVIVVIDG